ncbi:sulfotransferase family protein [Thioalkalivibrio thiocyanoxidans]|uniref:sulfotransferase family protein n=1 Tax=Thioalkalivibrio thiocyanoxidans TaxID=152475 RepID=UPI000369D9B9|nr:sulfotransferase family protein [Thioalkalivibrio thiocyanoxidans]
MHASRFFSERFNPLLSSLDGRVQKHRVNPRILVSTSQRFVFYRIPKAGHSTVGNTLLRYDPSITDDQRKAVQASGDKIGVYRHPRDIGLKRSREAWRKYFLFTFVRNPFHRTLSAYLDKVMRDRPPAEKNLGTGSVQNGAPLSFADFLQRLENGALYRGPHWAPQVSLLPRDRSRLDFAGRLEHIDRDLPALVEKLFGTESLAEVHNWDPHRTGSADKLADYYGGPEIDRIRKLYREDFEAFDYALEPNE